MSTMVIAEIKPWQLQKKNYTDFQKLIDALQADIHMVAPTPPILMQASRLRNHTYHQTPKQKDEKDRVLSGMDAVHLATCLYVRDVYEVRDIEFHTFDDGKGKNYEEKAVSLLRFQDYAKHINGDPDVDAVCALTRCKPRHLDNPMV